MKRIILVVEYYMAGRLVRTKEQVAWLDEQMIYFGLFKIKVSDTWPIPKDDVRSRYNELEKYLIIVDSNIGMNDSRFINLQKIC